MRRLILLLALLAPGVARADPNALWNIVHEQCVPNQEHLGSPLPCLLVGPGAAILKDRVGPAQFLLIPTARVTGIEDPAVLAPEAPNWFQLAWTAINAVRARAGADLPDDALSLVINSAYGRTQNQLHIHMDCLAPDARAAILAHLAQIQRTWSPFPVPLAGHQYLALRIDTLDRPGETPFQLAAHIPGARADMGRLTLLAAPATFPGPERGFVLLADRADPPADWGNAEELQDHSCALARK